MESSDDILNANKYLFAIDLVDYVILKTRPNFGDKTASILAQADRLRNFTYNRFDKTIKRALNIIDINQDGSVFSDFEEMMKEDAVNKESFITYANSYRKLNFPEEFHAKSFLMYCDRVANMAGYFLSYGVDDAPEVAVDLIMKAFPQSVMYHSTWKKITKVAATLEVLGNDYYGEDESDDSSSRDGDLISSENEGSSSNSVNMDVNMSSPEEQSEQNLEIASSVLPETSENINDDNNGSSKISMLQFFLRRSAIIQARDLQSSDNTCSSFLSSFKCSSNDTSTNEAAMSNDET